MKTNLLFPNRFKKIGWFLFFPFFILGFIQLFYGHTLEFDFLMYESGKNSDILEQGGQTLFTLDRNNFSDEIISIGLILGLILTAFSKEKIEDEWTSKLRLDSLLWGVYVNTVLLLLAIIFIYGELFWQVMILNLFTTLIIFIIRFNFILWKENKSTQSL